jgi:hypothetical protein
MSKDTLDNLREKLQTALDNADLSDFGEIDVTLGTMSYNKGSIFPVSVKIEVAKSGESQFAVNFQKNAQFYGLQPNDLGKTIEYAGKKLTIAGLNKRARKRPIILTGEDGKSYSMPAEGVIHVLTQGD